MKINLISCLKSSRRCFTRYFILHIFPYLSFLFPNEQLISCFMSEYLLLRDSLRKSRNCFVPKEVELVEEAELSEELYARIPKGLFSRGFSGILEWRKILWTFGPHFVPMMSTQLAGLPAKN